MIDLHTHLLPGIDDGPDTIEESLELAAAMAAEGVTIAACTPHVRDDYGTTPESMEAALALLQQELQAAGIPLAGTRRRRDRPRAAARSRRGRARPLRARRQPPPAPARVPLLRLAARPAGARHRTENERHQGGDRAPGTKRRGTGTARAARAARRGGRLHPADRGLTRRQRRPGGCTLRAVARRAWPRPPGRLRLARARRSGGPGSARSQTRSATRRSQPG